MSLVVFQHEPNETSAVLGATLLIGTVFIAINKLSDVLYRVLDPRAR